MSSTAAREVSRLTTQEQVDHERHDRFHEGHENETGARVDDTQRGVGELRVAVGDSGDGDVVGGTRDEVGGASVGDRERPVGEVGDRERDADEVTDEDAYPFRLSTTFLTRPSGCSRSTSHATLSTTTAGFNRNSPRRSPSIISNPSGSAGASDARRRDVV